MSITAPSLHAFVPGDATATPPTQDHFSNNKAFEIRGLDTLAADVAHIKANPAKAAEMDKKLFGTHVGAAALGGLIPSIPASLAAWKAWTADAKLNKAETALNHKLGILTKDAKIPGWLKASAVATLLVSAAGFIAGVGNKAAKRVV